MNQLTQIVSTPAGILAALVLAAYLEVQGDACFQSGLYHASGMRRFGWFLAGAAVLVSYSLFLNSSNVDFGKLLGVYVVCSFLSPKSWQSCNFINHRRSRFTSAEPLSSLAD